MITRLEASLAASRTSFWTHAPSMKSFFLTSTTITSELSKWTGLSTAAGLVALESPFVNYACYLAIYSVMGKDTTPFIEDLIGNLSTACLISAKTYVASNFINFCVSHLSQEKVIKDAAAKVDTEVAAPARKMKKME